MKEETIEKFFIYTNPLTWLFVLVTLFIQALIKAWEWVGIGDFYFAYFGIDYSRKVLVDDVIRFACKKSSRGKTLYTKWRFRRLAIIIKRKLDGNSI